MRVALLLASLLGYVLMGYAQHVSTLIAPGSGIDDMLFLASNGKIYGSGFDNGNLYVYDGNQVTLVTDTMQNANGIAEDSQGNLFVADHMRSQIWKVSSFGKVTLFTNIPRPSGIIKMPTSDTLLITSYTQDRIYKVAPDGTSSLYLIGGLLDGPVGLTYDDEQTLYIGNFDNGRILKVDSTGNLVEVVALPGGSLGFVIYSNGFLYATLFSSHKIYQIFPESGLYSLMGGSVAGNLDGPLSTATFNGPNGILASVTGDTLYVSDYNTERVRIITGLRPTSLEASEWPDLAVSFSTVVEEAVMPIRITTPTALAVTLQVQDLLGRVVYETSISIQQGENTLELSPQLSAGIHLLTISDRNRRYMRKFVKK